MDIDKIRELAGLIPQNDVDSVPSTGERGCEEEPEGEMGSDSVLTGVDPEQDSVEVVIAVIINPEAVERLKSQNMEQVGESSFVVEDADSFMSFMEENGYSLKEDFDLNNGYRNRQKHQDIDDYGDDYFPSGQTGTPKKRLGPSAAKHGNNPMYAKQFTEDASSVHERLVYEYREFKNKK